MLVTNSREVAGISFLKEYQEAKGANGMQLFALDCIAYIVGAETDRVFACMNGM